MCTGDFWNRRGQVTRSINSALAHGGPGLRADLRRGLREADHHVALSGCGPGGPRSARQGRGKDQQCHFSDPRGFWSRRPRGVPRGRAKGSGRAGCKVGALSPKHTPRPFPLPELLMTVDESVGGNETQPQAPSCVSCSLSSNSTKDISSLTQLNCPQGLSPCPGVEGKD